MSPPLRTIDRRNRREEPVSCTGDDLKRALTGQDALISTLGSREKDDLLNTFSGKPDRTMRRSREALIEAANVAGVRRVVVLSTFMLAANFKAGLLKPLAPLYNAMNEDKRAGEEALKKSPLDWTIVYATRLTDGESSGQQRLVPITETVTARNTVSGSDIATFLLAQLDDDAGIRKSLVLTAS